MGEPVPEFHIYGDAQIAGRGSYAEGRYGALAIGTLILTPAGRLVAETSRFLGHHTVNQGEMYAARYGLKLALQVLRAPETRRLVVHTDSDITYRILGLGRGEKEQLLSIRDGIEGLAEHFASVDYVRVPRNNLGIRQAESLARKALEQRLGIHLNRRGSKGNASRAAAHDPFNGIREQPRRYVDLRPKKR